MTVPRPSSLSTQLILSFSALVLLATLVVGAPAIWLLQQQLQRQAWAQVDQGRQAVQALYAAHQNEMAALATLTAERPSLAALLGPLDAPALVSYLDTLRQGAELDLIAVCSTGDQPLALAGDMAQIALLPSLCTSPLAPYLATTVPSGVLPQAWLVAAQEIASDSGPMLGKVIVGRWLDEDFAGQMRLQTGLDHTLLAGELPLVTSLPGGTAVLRQGEASAEGDHSTYAWAGRPYYAAHIPLESVALGTAALTAEVALDVTDVVSTGQRVIAALVASMVLATTAGALLSTLVARRISRPLASLADAATDLSQGDLSTPLAFRAHMREVALVGQALEGARVDLQRTLDELRAEKAWTDHLLSAIVEGIVTLDEGGRITFFSHGAERITGWARDAVVGQSCDFVFQTAGSDRPFSALIAGEGGRSKIPVVLHDGRQAVLAVTRARLLPPEGGAARVALVFRDISEEEAVRRLLSHFLANVSHEFRTPLSAIAASVELLLDQAPDLPPEELQELLTSLHLGVLNLQKLVDNLLESASIEAGRFRVHPRPAHLEDIIAEVIGVMQPLLDRQGQQLMVELPAILPLVAADPRRTVQVLVNLLSNASKYSPDHAEIAISACVQDGWVQVAVADQGPGIPPEHRRDLFRRFALPGPENGSGQPGFGLGLSVVKAIVEGHAGQVGVDDRPGGGSIFWFTLPLA